MDGVQDSIIIILIDVGWLLADAQKDSCPTTDLTQPEGSERTEDGKKKEP